MNAVVGVHRGSLAAWALVICFILFLLFGSGWIG